MTIIELVSTAHSYSTSIKQTGVYSELVREMASRLEALNLAHIGSMTQQEAAEKLIVTHDRQCDEQYLLGMAAGWNFGLTEDCDGYDAAYASRRKFIDSERAAVQLLNKGM